MERKGTVAQVLGPDAGQLLAGFQRQAGELCVREILRDEGLLVAGHLVYHPVLPGNVTRVLDFSFQTLSQHGRDALTPADHARDERIVDFRPAQQLFGNAALCGRGKARRLHGFLQVCRPQMGVMQAAAETGVDIPGQISLIGFDDVSFASLPKIQLTTISQPKEEICEVAVQTLEELIAADGPAPISCKTIEPVLVRRDTCGPSKGRALW